MSLQRSSLVLALVAAVGGGGEARADQPAATLNAGLEVLFGGESVSGGLRVHGGFGRSFGSGALQPTVSVGGTLAWGSISVDAPMASDPRVSATLFEIGPEVILSLRFANGGWVDKRLFVAGAAFFSRSDKGSAVGEVLEGAPQHGFRLGVGANWLDAWLVDEHEGGFSSDATNRKIDAVMMLFPHQVELVWERSLGLDRFGVAMAWGL